MRTTNISIPDDLLSAVDEAAKEAGISRSELFRRAARAYLDIDDLVRASNDGAFSDAGHAEDVMRRHSTRRILSKVDW